MWRPRDAALKERDRKVENFVEARETVYRLLKKVLPLRMATNYQCGSATVSI